MGSLAIRKGVGDQSACGIDFAFLYTRGMEYEAIMVFNSRDDVT